MSFLKTIFSDTIHLFYPHVCTGCGSDLVPEANLLCLRCLNDLPHTNFAQYADNTIEKIFWGRIPLSAAHCEFYFSKESLIQQLIHQFKYKNNRQIGFYLGKLLGKSLLESNRFGNVEAIVPLPLHAEKEHKRGYNQAAIICNGVSSVLNVPVISNNVVRIKHTDTQTKKQRTQRWDNVSGSFTIREAGKLTGKNLLLIDDVITTGATLEACGNMLVAIDGVKLSIAALAYAPK